MDYYASASSSLSKEQITKFAYTIFSAEFKRKKIKPRMRSQEKDFFSDYALHVGSGKEFREEKIVTFFVTTKVKFRQIRTNETKNENKKPLLYKALRNKGFWHFLKIV
jgi:hypothetical protein